ncbi:hypothetical protein BO94DRAFT_315554 [Aspergillus sclerotioniger CBS 115572]|uniref:Aminoglycoside phosphotransferase domain-containing protein n=1 Tax=Aspergillus sclerotioniger CBS 115572 TaxID=1450535 RepID=A0A317X8Q4_9EURO|nr:hypothetical protein BO94DRAFT_315554 [Aspergillus sclerotioniger CBS 115572]PWY93957.1 hypothetical protein BO94DRAFT_315554 [Aspergillus sclerotioniger CBS 115572]
MSKAPGWQLAQAWKEPGFGKPELAAHLKAKVVRQLGAMTYKLSQLRFAQIGSLLERDGVFRVGECLSCGHILHDRHSLEDVTRGPFTTETPFFDSLIAALKEHAEVLPLSPHCFVAPIPSRGDYESIEQYHKARNLWNDFVTIGNKIDSSDNRLDYIVVADALRNLISVWRSQLPKTDTQSFPLCHADLSINNIYVDDDYNITCIIDWGFSSTVPEAMMLIPPGLPQSRDELNESLVAAFRNGFVSAVSKSTNLERSEIRDNAASILQQRCSWLLTRLLNFDSLNDYSLFAAAWKHTYGHEGDIRAKIVASLCTVVQRN